ncbi:MAG: helix-turn-helix domain-containing protein [Clostridiales bacterium]|nr:helix-turn-helix domain-containing protein [Clostridiales bacterium]
MEQVQVWAEALGEWLTGWGRLARLFWREIVSGVPLFVLFALGERGAKPTAFLWCLVWLVLLVLACNPFGVFYNVLAPKTRACAVGGLLLAMCAAALWWLSLYGRLCLALLAVALETLAVWKRKPWLLAWQVLQSPEVDLVLAHLAHGEEWTPGTAWETEGCRQVRSLLHQALDMECNEAEIDRAYKAVYLLAYLCGMEGREAEVERLKKALSKAQAEANQWQTTAICKDDTAQELANERAENAKLREQYSQLSAKARAYYQAAQDAEAELSAWRPEEAEGSKEAAVLAYLEQGHSYAQAAQQFGISKTSVANIVKANREARPP